MHKMTAMPGELVRLKNSIYLVPLAAGIYHGTFLGYMGSDEAVPRGTIGMIMKSPLFSNAIEIETFMAGKRIMIPRAFLEIVMTGPSSSKPE